MRKSETIQENKMDKIPWDFETQTDHLIPARSVGLVQNIKERTCCQVDFAISVDHRVKIKESEKRDKYFVLAKELK